MMMVSHVFLYVDVLHYQALALGMRVELDDRASKMAATPEALIL